ncbi:Gfo/Idh/MocA family oxidoreductase [Candidatus Woesearchaeota archaeon]|nr:Gfo/Idh/MocA family oxidoreductase [Candidatus Woesearchaeota archaeon]
MNTVVIGVGNMGQHHARVYSTISSSNLVAVSDLNEEAGMTIAKKYSCKYYKSYIEMLEKEDIDAVSIAVPTSLHKKVALDVLKYNKHILLEKPIADTIQNAQEIITGLKSKQTIFMVGHVERFNPAVQKFKEILREKKIGNLISIIARRVGPYPPKVRDTNVIIDLAVHDIDVMSFLLEEEPTLISSHGKATVSEKEDYAEIFLKYNSVTSFIQVNWLTPIKIRNLSVTGTEGYAELDYITQDLVIYKKDKNNEAEKIHIDVDKEEPLVVEIRSFLNSIKNNSESPLSAAKALNTIKIASLAAEVLSK